MLTRRELNRTLLLRQHLLERTSMPALSMVEHLIGLQAHDVPAAPYASADAEAPVRLLGTYDNLWLSHVDRTHVVPDDVRPRWMGSNGGVASTVFVDGFMAGLWRWRDGRVVTELYRRLTKRQRSELDDEVDRVTRLLGT